MALLTLLSLSLTFVISCANVNHHRPPAADEEDLISSNLTVNPELEKATAVLWFRYAAESRALYYQAYNIATWRLAQAVANSCDTNKLAVIMDIDETILDNTPFQAFLIAHGTNFNESAWNAWAKQARSQALPGATNFLQYAHSCNVDIFYLSNRSTNLFEVTQTNLENLGFPCVNKAHLLLQQTNEGKEPHRQWIEKNYEVVLLMGDYLDDLSSVGANTVKDRFAWADTNQQNFGSNYIVLPNPMYGNWEDPIYKTEKNPKPSEQDKIEIRWQKLRDLARPVSP